MKIEIWTENDEIKFKVDPEKENPDNIETLFEMQRIVSELALKFNGEFLIQVKEKLEEIQKSEVR